MVFKVIGIQDPMVFRPNIFLFRLYPEKLLPVLGVKTTEFIRKNQLQRFDCGLIVSGGVLSLPRLPVWVLPGCAGPCFGVLLRRISVLTI